MLILSIAMMIFITGCASIVSKSEYTVNISSDPTSVNISIKNGEGKEVFVGKTPTTIRLKASRGYFKGEDYTVTFKKEGIITHTAQIYRGVDGWYFAGNIFIGGLIGWFIVDPATGAMWTLENLHVKLNDSKMSLNTSTIKVITLDDLPLSLRSNMVKIN